jgi:hypothetical protein
MGCGGVAGGVDRSAGGLEIRFAIRALATVAQVFALVLRNGIEAGIGGIRGCGHGAGFRFAIRTRANVVQGVALELRNEFGFAWGGRKPRSSIWKSVGVVRKK